MYELTARELGFLAERFEGVELDRAIKRAEDGEPLAYVLGEWYFYGLTIALNSDCLVPRPDTEHVVDRAISLLPPNARFADLGCGSGCIALSVLHERPDCSALLCDISENALDCARLNAERLGLAGKAEFATADMKTDFLPDGFDAIISNPPYVRSGEIAGLSEQVRREPRRALDGGEDGMDFYRSIFSLHFPHIAPGGPLILEIGYDQADGIRELAANHGADCHVFRDYGGNDRVAVCRKI